MPISKDEFRQSLSRFASGVTVVTTRDADGCPRGMTVSAFCSLSLEPPLVLICIDKTAESHPAFSQSGVFAVNVLADNQEFLSRQFSTAVEDRFAGIAYHAGLDGVPVLDGALANLQCRLVHSYDGGDHTIFVGQIEATTVREGNPLLYFRGRYRQLAE
ncbi:MAG: flavin reductase family protein [Acidobacteriota bacterium]|nr:flavin reductase family protein [Blastocatellia bacterium]MDW8238718.1 flavin reductase family protein [Acidobacteriota bacterium]